MPSIKLPRKSTDTDMTPFVDIAFLILSFFIMATKFKPAEPVPVTTPNSVSADILKEENSLLITIDKDNRVFVKFNVIEGDKEAMQQKYLQIIKSLNDARNLGLTSAQMANFQATNAIGVPFSSLGGLLNVPAAEQAAVRQQGIPVLDSLNNELVWWVGAAKTAFANQKLLYLLKGDNDSKYPTFEGVINALRRNEVFKYNLITSQEAAPAGSELYLERNK
ncbi:MAG: biopolymer transporter ExbD [Chitinophagaceae bacterium]